MKSLGIINLLTLLWILNITSAASDSIKATPNIGEKVLENINSYISKASSSVEGRQYGCTDSFSVFGFLAFLLALLDLILELQGNARRKRGVHGMDGQQDYTSSCQGDGDYQQAASASYSLLRGFLNALGTTDSNCAERFMCEAAQEAAEGGPVGEVIAHVGSLNAGSWLVKVNSSLYTGAGDAGQAGGMYKDCALRYSQCYGLHNSYRHPGIMRDVANTEEDYLEMDQIHRRIMREVIGSVAQTVI